MTKFTKENFKEEVLESEKLVLVDFWAEWCYPCRIIAPVLEEVDKEYNNIVKIGKINVDEHPEIAEKYGIISIPTLAFFKKGKVVDTLIGAVPKKEIVEKIKSLTQ